MRRSARVAFIDTSVLCNLVPGPGRDQDQAAVRAELSERTGRGQQFVLPVTAVIETGNFVAQVADGGARRRSASRLGEILALVAKGKSPWVLHSFAWDAAFLARFLEGAGTGSTYVDHAVHQVGAGDLCILTERDLYQRRSGIDADIWTMDQGLSAYR